MNCYIIVEYKTSGPTFRAVYGLRNALLACENSYCSFVQIYAIMIKNKRPELMLIETKGQEGE